MIDRLRVLMDRPLDTRVAFGAIAMAVCVTVGFAIVVGFGGMGGSPAPERSTVAAARPSAPPPPDEAAPQKALATEPATPSPIARRQDSQDRRGTPAFHRAKRTLRAHRALQHLPYRNGRLRITLVGADRGRAVLQVRASSVPKAKQAWRKFLKRFHDSGRSYEPRFAASPTRGGS